ncbi:MAG: type II toxin-antitoxin system RelE/ParE family toxin [Acidobacteriota bacterium]|nr:type II toxin-antitoxin system RelE/ParE family toxin [Acidobacteriota bacterium]
MRVRWTTDAANDLERICDYIAESRPESARTVAKTIVDGVGILELFPNRGRLGRVDATRELVFASLPFVAVYDVHSDAVQVLRILHGAQQWPPPPESTKTE